MSKDTEIFIESCGNETKALKILSFITPILCTVFSFRGFYSIPSFLVGIIFAQIKQKQRTVPQISAMTKLLQVPVVTLYIVLIIASTCISSLWMYSQAFHLQLFGTVRVIVHHSYFPAKESKIQATSVMLRMTNIDPTNTDTFLNSTTGIPSPIGNGVLDEAKEGVVKNRAKNDARRNDHTSSESSQKISQQQQQQQSIRSPKKYHHLSVCMVPPESSVEVWEAITKCRIQLKDPGLYRWPPHANLLYPFIDVRPASSTDGEESADHDETLMAGDNDDDNDMMQSITPPVVDPTIIEGLLRACRQIEPFNVRLHQFGTFGSSKRGVLWLFPDSYMTTTSSNTLMEDESDVDYKSPLVQLQEVLVESFPYCNDQNVKSNEGFNPHMTISHFINHQDALEAQKQVESWWLTPNSTEQEKMTLHFPVEYIYVLQRFGDSGQFLRVADIPLGSSSCKTSEAIVHPVPIPFVHMPTAEADWVYEERMKLKQRRNGQWRSRGGGSTSSTSRSRSNANHTFMIVDDIMNTTATIDYKK